MRNADLSIDEDEAADLLKEIQKQLKMRQWGEVIRLEVEDGIDKKLLNFLKDELKVAEQDIFQINGPIDFTFLMKMYGLEGCDDLRNEPYTPQRVPEIVPGKIFLMRSEKEISFCIIHTRRLIRWLILYVRHLWIRMYLPSNRHFTVSAAIHQLLLHWHRRLKTARCFVLVELKARFDEENNIVWAKKLEARLAAMLSMVWLD